MACQRFPDDLKPARGLVYGLAYGVALWVIALWALGIVALVKWWAA
jgi:hypothetical protein